MKVLELFAGTRAISQAFATRGHETYSVDWDRKLGGMSLYADIGTLAPRRILTHPAFGRIPKNASPSALLASPQ